MDKSLKTILSSVFGDLQILSPEAFRLGDGAVHHAAEPPVFGPLPASVPVVHPLVPVMTGVLYLEAYAHQYTAPKDQPGYSPDAQLPLKLDQANSGQDQWSSGWQVFRIAPDGTASVSRGETQRMARPGEYLASNGRSAVPAVGEVITLHLPRGSHTMQPGFYYMYGEEPGDVWADHTLFRFYFRTAPQGGPFLVEWITAGLNAFQVPFRMKSLTDATHYSRSDTTVLYVARRYADVVTRFLLDASRPEAANLQGPTPLFTFELAPGIALADDPGTMESFGMHRCRMLAEAALTAHARNETDVEARLKEAEARFTAEGLDLDRPWLGVGLSDVFPALAAIRDAA